MQYDSIMVVLDLLFCFYAPHYCVKLAFCATAGRDCAKRQILRRGSKSAPQGRGATDRNRARPIKGRGAANIRTARNPAATGQQTFSRGAGAQGAASPRTRSRRNSRARRVSARRTRAPSRRKRRRAARRAYLTISHKSGKGKEQS